MRDGGRVRSSGHLKDIRGRVGDWYGIAGCETGGTYYNRAVGGAGELGWFQIHPVHFGWADPGQLSDARYNTRAAWRLSSGGTNAGPWTCA